MEKLIELINKYVKERKGDYIITDYDEKGTGFDVILDGKIEFIGEESILCKRYGFIKWLCERGLIDEDKEIGYYILEGFDKEDAILMMLAINEDPINLLLKYIKYTTEEEKLYARMPEGVIGIEDWNRYDGIAYYLDKETGQKYSRNGYPIADDEMCKWGKIYKVETIKTGEGNWDYKFKILSIREDSPTSA